VNIRYSVNTTKPSAAALEKALAAKLHELLSTVPGIPGWKVQTNPAPFNQAFDLLATGKSPHGPVIELWVDCRSEPRPSQFPYVQIERQFEKDSTKLVRARVFAAPHISPRMAEICESHGWSWFDLAGNCKITAPTLLHIERRGHSPVHETPRPTANLSTPEAGRVIRALLAPENAGFFWTQRYMVIHFGQLPESIPEPSLGLVNKVVRYLREEAFIEESPTGGFRLRDPLKLLFAWRDAYRFDRHLRQGYFTLLKGEELREAFARLGTQTGGFAAYAAFSAADFQAPHVRQPKTWLYVREKEIPKFARLLDAKPVESGENVIALVPQDDGIFYMGDGGMRGEHRLACTNAVQTYVDLWHVGGRGEEAAGALLEQKLKPQWRNKGLKA
jgi:transcriptional regulator with XRE-family HTH domain